MTPSSRIVVTTGNNLNAGIKVAGVPRSVFKEHVHKKGATTTTASETWGIETKDTQDKAKPKPIQDALNLKEVVGRSVGLPYHEVTYMTGKDLRDRADRLVLEAYIQSKTFTDQCYTKTGNTIKVTKKCQSEQKVDQKTNPSPTGTRFQVYSPVTHHHYKDKRKHIVCFRSRFRNYSGKDHQ